MVDFSILSSFENVALMIKLDQSFPGKNFQRFPSTIQQYFVFWKVVHHAVPTVCVAAVISLTSAFF